MKFEVWAPKASDVDLALGEQRIRLTAAEQGWFTGDADAVVGDRYGYVLHTDDGESKVLPDPRSLSQPDGPDERSAVVDLGEYDWQDGEYTIPPLRGGVIYEMHVGTFTPDGTFASAIDRLDYLADLGVTVVEIMPVAAFPGSRGWGYDGVCPYAVFEPYGGAAGLQRFVDACHQRGLAVCLDVVYNHLGPSGNYLPSYGPYFTDAYKTPWGSAVNLDGPGSDHVRRYFLDNAMMWLRDFHIDALRLDAVHALLDSRALPFLEQLAAEVVMLATASGRELTLIAESDRNDPGTVSARNVGGLGMDAQWADDVHHALHVRLTGETGGYYGDFANPDALPKVLRTPFFHDGTYSTFRERHHGRPVDPATAPGWRFVASLQTHDQVGNRATGDRLAQLVSVGRVAAGAAILLTSPYTPMLFMGEEWGATTPWQYFTDHQDPELAKAVSKGRKAEFASHGWGSQVPDPQDEATFIRSRLDWSQPTGGDHARLLDWYRTLITLRQQITDLSDASLGTVATTIDDDLIRIQRGAHRLVVNLRSESVPIGLGPGEVVVAAFDAELDRTTAGSDKPVVNVDPDGTVLVGPATS
ncbi:malto-oligosyltrehalose trehalohydrolase [Branchiibius sp. NY16-3462-2]|uniref:malto-oligosyltrehalose trehalohydrolase n=1 Tax=Branchiibius sp. NY16-3462-2 TaxID=1807500 RepID=UPI000795718D|nr:malto-oligosyltrehalose trehalohydrolase [Branchiibius sp. NY16-3462-2]KYH43544.1 malto-oligosyltrehalose trehalohydrolase [Branchiibius sp. NY16-3462-2]